MHFGVSSECMLWFECTLIPVISSLFHPAPARECIIFALLSDVYARAHAGACDDIAVPSRVQV